MTAVRRLTATPGRSLSEVVWEQRGQIDTLQTAVKALQAELGRQRDVLADLRRELRRLGCVEVTVLDAPPANPDPIAAPPAGAAPEPARARREGGAGLVLRGGALRPLVEDVAKRHGIRASDILGPVRAMWIVRARHEVMYLARETGLSMLQIGQALGRDHSTVMHGIAAHKRRAGLE